MEQYENCSLVSPRLLCQEGSLLQRASITGQLHSVSSAGFKEASSQVAKLRGVTRHRRTQRFEAHIWEERRQIYIGGYDVSVHLGSYSIQNAGNPLCEII
jgi:hypothetical protein